MIPTGSEARGTHEVENMAILLVLGWDAAAPSVSSRFEALLDCPHVARTAMVDFDLPMFWQWRTRFSAAFMISHGAVARH